MCARFESNILAEHARQCMVFLIAHSHRTAVRRIAYDKPGAG